MTSTLKPTRPPPPIPARKSLNSVKMDSSSQQPEEEPHERWEYNYEGSEGPSLLLGNKEDDAAGVWVINKCTLTKLYLSVVNMVFLFFWLSLSRKIFFITMKASGDLDTISSTYFAAVASSVEFVLQLSIWELINTLCGLSNNRVGTTTLRIAGR